MNLFRDLQERTGISKINRVEVGKINFLRDTCDLTVYYFEKKGKEYHSEENTESNNNNDDDDD